MNEQLVQDCIRDLDELCRVYASIGYAPTLKTMLTLQAKLRVAVDVPAVVRVAIPPVEDLDE